MLLISVKALPSASTFQQLDAGLTWSVVLVKAAISNGRLFWRRGVQNGREARHAMFAETSVLHKKQLMAGSKIRHCACTDLRRGFEGAPWLKPPPGVVRDLLQITRTLCTMSGSLQCTSSAMARLKQPFPQTVEEVIVWCATNFL